jgi:hypothetical protein
MITHFIIWDKSVDTAFRAMYQSITGEAIQLVPKETADDRYVVGTSRLTDSHHDAIVASGGQITTIAPDLKSSE